MGKRKEKEIVEESGRGTGFLVVILIMTIIGLVVWFAMSRDD